MIQIWLRNFLFFRKTILVSLFWTILEPLMYLTAIGFGLGQFVERIEGLSFIEFYYPGLLASTAMMVSYFEATYSNYTKLTHQKIYSTMLMTPLTDKDIVFGEIIWSATKGLIAVLGVGFISLFFGLFKLNFFTSLPVLFLVCLVFASFGMLMTSVAKNYDTFIFSTSGIIIPISLMSGTYFSIESVPDFFRGLAWGLPLYHGVKFTRDLFYKSINYYHIINVLILLAYIFVLMVITLKFFRKKVVH